MTLTSSAGSSWTAQLVQWGKTDAGIPTRAAPSSEFRLATVALATSCLDGCLLGSLDFDFLVETAGIAHWTHAKPNAFCRWVVKATKMSASFQGRPQQDNHNFKVP